MNKYQKDLNKITYTIADLSEASERWIKESEAVKSIQELVDRATPMKVETKIRMVNGIPIKYLLCPSCKTDISKFEGYAGCPHCLQAIDWSDEE